MDMDTPMVSNELIAHLLGEFALRWDGIHGLSHWVRVYRNGLWLAYKMKLEHEVEVDQEVIALFAVLHDAGRVSDGVDENHGSATSALVSKLSGAHFNISPPQEQTLTYACLMHHQDIVSFEPTVGVCWDANRLDLSRVGLKIDPRFLSTQAAKDYVSLKP